jgi:hypothetical protein
LGVLLLGLDDLGLRARDGGLSAGNCRVRRDTLRRLLTAEIGPVAVTVTAKLPDATVAVWYVGVVDRTLGMKLRA